jgi:PBP1b-binding outer membrane lipoprotein LpoB
MKKILLISISALFAVGCAEKGEYEAAVLEEMKKEQEVKDYHIDPETMADCVVDTTTQNMPGFADFDPKRRSAYKNYTKMLTLMKSADPKKTLDELRKDFGSPKALADAHNNFTESMMNCYSAIMVQSEPEQEDKEPKNEAATPNPEPPKNADAPAQPSPGEPAKK